MDPEVEGFLALLAARRAPRTVEAYRRDLTAVGTWLGKPVGRTSTEDLERYLRDEPILARAPSTLTRIYRFVRRRKIPIIASAMELGQGSMTAMPGHTSRGASYSNDCVGSPKVSVPCAGHWS